MQGSQSFAPVNREFVSGTIISTEESFNFTEVGKYKVNLDPRFTNLFELKMEELNEILTALNGKYQDIEKSDRPAAGYEVSFKVFSQGKRPIEVVLEACGERRQGTEMEMPKIKSECGFCRNQEQMEGYGEALSEHARVIRSLEGNPLTISKKHASHFFEMFVEEQRDLFLTALKVIDISARGSSRHQVSAHVGVHGHQTFPHAHMHVMASLGKKKEEGSQKTI